MWERLAFYTMLGVLLLYVTDMESGGLGLPAAEGNEIYGLYLAFVYFTPFLGGILADRYLGYRRAVVLGGVLMAGGLFLMSVPGLTPFVTGLGLLIIGNGFFKPNISVMVGNIYQPGDPKRDAGFNIFYMGINIGAFVANLLAASVRNEFGWLWTFRVAGIGLLIGLAILLSTWKTLEKADRRPERSKDDTSLKQIGLSILLPAGTVGVLAYFLASAYLPEGFGMRPAVVGFMAGAIPIIIFFVRLGLTAKPEEKPGLLALLPIFVAGGTFFMILHLNGSAMTQWARDNTARESTSMPATFLQDGLPSYYGNAASDVPRPHPDTLLVVDEPSIARMYGQQRLDETALAKVAGKPGVQIVDVAETATDSVLKARSSNVYADGVITVREGTDSHGAKSITVEIPDGAKAKKRVAFTRETADGTRIPVYLVDEGTHKQIYDGYKERFGKDPELLPPGQFVKVINPEIYQSFNPLFVIAFTPLVVAFFGFLTRRNVNISTARKICMGLGFTTISLLVMALAGFLSDNGMSKVSWLWLAGFYAIVTIGELHLSPMGLSLVTKLSPKRLVGLTMGGWFLATAFGNNFSGFFGGIQGQMEPANFFLLLAGLAGLATAFIFVLLPRLDAAIKKYGA
jgi:dipeptide/tripeptide permease